MFWWMLADLLADNQEDGWTTASNQPLRTYVPGPDELPSAPVLGEKIAQLIDAHADALLIAESYAAFERFYPKAVLPGQSQLQAAKILRDCNYRMLAVEAFRKVPQQPLATPEQRSEALLGLAALFAESPAMNEEALRAIRSVSDKESTPEQQQRAEALERGIRQRWEAVFPIGNDGKEESRPAGPCAILAESTAKVNIPAVAQALAPFTGQTPLDLRVALARTPGILARNIDPVTAEGIARELQANGIPVIVIGEDRCPPLPQPALVHSIQVQKEGFLIRAESGAQKVRRDDIRLAHFGYIPAPGKTVATLNVPNAAFVERLKPGYVATHAIASSANPNLRGVCDLYTFAPLRRFRLLEGKLSLEEILPAKTGFPRSYEMCVKRVLTACPSLPMNESLDVLFCDRLTSLITCKSLQHFDNYASWIYLLTEANCAAS